MEDKEVCVRQLYAEGREAEEAEEEEEVMCTGTL